MGLVLLLREFLWVQDSLDKVEVFAALDSSAAAKLVEMMRAVSLDEGDMLIQARLPKEGATP